MQTAFFRSGPSKYALLSNLSSFVRGVNETKLGFVEEEVLTVLIILFHWSQSVMVAHSKILLLYFALMIERVGYGYYYRYPSKSSSSLVKSHFGYNFSESYGRWTFI